MEALATTSSTRKPGRPAKAAATNAATKSAAKPSTAKASGKKPGRPAKAKAVEPEEAPDAIDTPAPRKRHSAPKGGETTKIAADDGDAADQLEGELVDAAQETAKPGRKRKAATSETPAPAKSIKGKGKARGKAAAVEADDSAATPTSEGKNYWLLKAEQVDRLETLKSGREVNTKFTIDDLKAATEPEMWEGVRNVVARNNMRAMKQGDLAFFYASNSKGKLQPGITGIMEIVREAEPDPTVYNPDSYGFVEDEKKRDWSVVHVEFRKKLSKPVSLKHLQKYAGSGVLGEMQVLNSARTSVTRVSEKEWNFITKELIEDYDDGANDDDDAAALGVPVPKPDPKLPPTVSAEAPLDSDLTSTDTALPATTLGTSRPTSRAASRQSSLAPVIIETAENSMIIQSSSAAVDGAASTSRAGSKKPASRAGSKQPATRAGSKQPASRAGSKQPASRAGSLKPASRAGSVKPASRAGSLAPPERPASRGRSRTPKVHGSSVQPDIMDSVVEELEDEQMGVADVAREMELA